MPPTVLIVDDEPDSCDTLAKILRQRGYQAEVAYTGVAALRLVKDHEYALAIIDYQMPEMNGVELFHEMRQLRPEITGIFLTGYTTINVVYPAVREGIVRILPKPVDFSELNSIVDEIVGATT